MKCNELYIKTQEQSLEKNKLMKAAKKLNESRKAELYTRLNKTVFDGLDLNSNNSRIIIGKDDVLEHTTSKLATIARDYSVLTVSIPLNALKKPFIATTAEDINTLKLCDFIHNFDELARDLMTESLANRIINLDSEKSFKLSIFEMQQHFIEENETIQKICAEHNQYLTSFEVVSNQAKTKKSKEGMVLDFNFGFITNYPETKTNHPKSDHSKPENATIPKVQVIEVKDPSELPKAIRDLLGEIL